MPYQFVRIFVVLLFYAMTVQSQGKPVWTALPQLPDVEGFAGMFAAVSKGTLFCMGGANFPGKRPWEGGTKKWYNTIYRLADQQWVTLKDTLDMPLAYGAAVGYKDRMIIAGGSTSTAHSSRVVAYAWSGSKLLREKLPDLPVPLANMAGALVGSLFIVAGGNSLPAGPGLNACYALDLEATAKGWFSLPGWPGSARVAPACAVVNGSFYLFSGETVGETATGQSYRRILDDAYRFTPMRQDGAWTGKWTTLSAMPKGATAAGLPLPVFPDNKVMFWGGVDAVTSAYKDPASHPGIMRDVLLYDATTDSWQNLGRQDSVDARVTLPVVYWNCGWVFVSGEVRPGIRTNTVYSVR